MDPFATFTPDAGAAALVALAVKGSLLFLLAFLVVGFLGRASAATRHAVWTFALGAALVLPVLFLVVPGWQVPVLPGSPAPPAPEAPVAPEAPPAPRAFAIPAPAPMSPVIVEREARRGITVLTQRYGRGAVVVEHHTAGAPAVAFGFDTAEQHPEALSSGFGSDWRVWLLLVWAAGVAVVALRWVLAVLGAWRLVQTAEPVYDLDWLELKERVAFGMDLSRPVRLLRSDRVSIPVAGGVFDPVVVLPRDADTWSEERREVVLTHELAHLVRRDCLTQTLAQGALAIHWFNPLAWMSYRRFMLEREHACDDFVLNNGALASDYAQHLVEIARRFRRESLALAATAPMARRSNLEGRILSILDPEQNRKGTTSPRLAAVGVLTLALVAPLAAFQPVEGEADVTPLASVYDTPTLPAVSVIAPAIRTSDDPFTWEGRVGAGGFVEIHGVNGSIRARTGSGDQVRVEAEKTSRRGQEDEVEIVVAEFANGVVLCAVYPGQRAECEPGQGARGDVRDSDVQVTFEVVLPENVRFLGHTVNGSIRTETLGADVEARTVNGSVETASRHGNVAASTVNGSITAEAAGGVQANTTNGSITARLGRAGWEGQLAFETTNGSIILELPDAFNADVRAQAGTGSIKSDFPLDIHRNGYVGSEAEGQIGSGGRQLHLEVLNGSIHLRRHSGSFGSYIENDGKREHDHARAAYDYEWTEHDHEQVRRGLREVERTMAEIGPIMEQAMAKAGRAMAQVDFEAEIARAMEDVDWAEIEAEMEAAFAEASVEMDEAFEEALLEREEAWIDAEGDLEEALNDIRSELADVRSELEELDGAAQRSGRDASEIHADRAGLRAAESALQEAERGLERALCKAREQRGERCS